MDGADRDEELAALHAEVANLRIALSTNRRISMAMGILMCEKKLTENESFELLRNASQHTHTKLSTIAETVILGGTLDAHTDAGVAATDSGAAAKQGWPGRPPELPGPSPASAATLEHRIPRATVKPASPQTAASRNSGCGPRPAEPTTARERDLGD